MALEHNAYLGRDDLGKLLRSFSLPCILSLLVSALYNIVDQIFIGNSELGYLGNAATGVVFPLLMVAMAFGWCVGDGCAAYLSLCQGKGDAQSAHRCVGSGITMTFAASVFLMIVCGIWQEPLLRLFGASDTTIGMAMEYFTILLGAFPFYMLTNSTNGSIRADGSPKYAMLSTVSGAVTNIVLDPIFIFGLHWGIKGAAWATVAGQVLSFVLNAVYLLRKTKSFRLEKASFKPHWRVFFASVQLGISTFVTQISIVVVSLVCNLMLSHPVRLRAGHPHLRHQHRDEGLYHRHQHRRRRGPGRPAHFGLQLRRGEIRPRPQDVPADPSHHPGRGPCRHAGL